MKFEIYGFNQQKAIKLGLDDRDLIILRCFVDNRFLMSDLIIDEKAYYLVKYDDFVEYLPIIKFKKDTIYRHFKNLTDKGVLIHKTVKKHGTWSFYRLGENYDYLINK